MSNYTKRMEYLSLLCDKLNEAGIRMRVNENVYRDWHVTDYIFLGGFCSDRRAYKFLKDNGYIDMGICPNCGEYPIDATYRFTSAFNSEVHYNICKSCYKSGSRNSLSTKSDKDGCYIATVCYGDSNSPQVIVFRNYRDRVLNKNIL